VPAGLFDVQVAAGLVGMEYPAAYHTLLSKLLGETSQKPETRTDWRRRPLSQRQTEYALDDVRHLLPLREILHARLRELGRSAWLEEEMATWQDEIRRALSAERWRRISGISGLDRRSLAIARELYYWRHSEAQRRDQPVRRVLRDDLIVELARRQTADVGRIRAVRGLERGDLRKCLNEIAACIQRALDLPEEEYPARIPRDQMPQLSVLGQFLFVALGNLCRQARLAPNFVACPNDIRELIAYRAGGGSDRRPPQLAQGWREQFHGHFFDDLLAGKTSVRVGDVASEQPLIFESGAASRPETGA
jgi:ribonuclease D